MENKKYNVVYADPPWKYNDANCVGNAKEQYPVMPLEDICNMPIKNMIDKNAILFMWVTAPFLEDGFKVIKEWGFKYKTIGFVWLKHYPKKKRFVKGLGHYTRGNAELVLIGCKGHPKIISKSISQVFESERREHSRKPDEIRELIGRLVPLNYSKIEFFARVKHEDWDVFGNQVSKFEEIKNNQRRLFCEEQK